MPIRINGVVCFVISGSLVASSVIGWKNDALWEQPHTHQELFVPDTVTVSSPSVSGSNVAARTVDISHSVDMHVADWRLAKRN
jgi:hypothetical protein